MTGLHGKSNGDVGAQVYLLEGHELEICGGGGAGGSSPRASLTGGRDSVPTRSFCDKVRNRKADFINKNINTYHRVDITLSALCVLTYLIADVN